MRSATREAGDPGSNPAIQVGKQLSRSSYYTIIDSDVRGRLRSPILTFATKKLATGANGQKEDSAYLLCPQSFDSDRAVMEREKPERRDSSSSRSSVLVSAAGNRCHLYIGKVCCLLLVRADYISAPGRAPEGTGNCPSCYGVPESGKCAAAS